MSLVFLLVGQDASNPVEDLSMKYGVRLSMEHGVHLSSKAEWTKVASCSEGHVVFLPQE